MEPLRGFCVLLAFGEGGGFVVVVGPFPGGGRRRRLADRVGVGGAVWEVSEGDAGATTTAGTARSCLREPGLGRPLRSVEPLTAFSDAPFGVAVVEVDAGGLRETEGTFGDGEGELLAVSC